jgi:hypothetical protein
LQSLDLTGVLWKYVGQMMALNAEGMNTNPILREWYNKSVFEKIEKLYREENGIQVVDFLYDTFWNL